MLQVGSKAAPGDKSRKSAEGIFYLRSQRWRWLVCYLLISANKFSLRFVSLTICVLAK